MMSKIYEEQLLLMELLVVLLVFIFSIGFILLLLVVFIMVFGVLVSLFIVIEDVVFGVVLVDFCVVIVDLVNMCVGVVFDFGVCGEFIVSMYVNGNMVLVWLCCDLVGGLGLLCFFGLQWLGVVLYIQQDYLGFCLCVIIFEVMIDQEVFVIGEVDNVGCIDIVLMQQVCVWVCILIGVYVGDCVVFIIVMGCIVLVVSCMFVLLMLLDYVLVVCLDVEMFNLYFVECIVFCFGDLVEEFLIWCCVDVLVIVGQFFFVVRFICVLFEDVFVFKLVFVIIWQGGFGNCVVFILDGCGGGVVWFLMQGFDVKQCCELKCVVVVFIDMFSLVFIGQELGL